MTEIKIYGEIVPTNDKFITEDGEGGYCTLAHVQEQLKGAKGQPITVRINSFGGDVNAGFAIYAELRRYAKQHGVKITTFGEAYVSSIATIIFLAGDVRILTAHTSPFVHNAWYETAGDAKHMTDAARELDKASDEMAKHYEAHTKLTYEEARALMDAETYITVQEALSIGFATQIEEVERPKALSRFVAQKTKVKQNNNKMSKPKSLKERVLAFIQMFPLAKEVTTADERLINFPDLAEDEEPKVGDMATIDGQPAEGSEVMKSGETYVFVAGELTEIIAAEEEEDEDSIMASQTYQKLKSEFDELSATTTKALDIADGLQARVTELEGVKSKAPAKPKARTATPPAKPAEKEEVTTKLASIKARALGLGAK